MAKANPNDLQQRNQRAQNAENKSKGALYKRLHEMPQFVGIIIMIVLMIAAVYVGNFRTLSGLISKAEASIDMTEPVALRVAAAGNLLTIATRDDYDVSEERVANLTKARNNLQKASGAQAISKADQSLFDAVSMVNSELQKQDNLSGGDKESITSVMAQFNEAGNMIRQEARKYNQQIEHAISVYERLPFRFLLSEPQEYHFAATTSELLEEIQLQGGGIKLAGT